MGFSINDVNIATSIIYKGRVAPKGSVFYIAKLVDKKNNKEFTVYKLVDRREATTEQVDTFVFSLKQHLVNQVNN